MSYLLDNVVTKGGGWSFNSSSVALNGFAYNGHIVGTPPCSGVAHAALPPRCRSSPAGR